MEKLFYAKQVYEQLGYKFRGNLNNKKGAYIRWCKIHIENKFKPDIDYVKIVSPSGLKFDTDYIISTEILETIRLTLIRHCPQHSVLDRLNNILYPQKRLEYNEDTSIDYVDYEIFDRIILVKEESKYSETIPEPIDLGNGVTIHHKDDMGIYRGTVFGDVWDEEDKPPFDEYEEI